MRIFLTGATGFIGRHVLRALCDAGHAVTASRRGPAPPPDAAIDGRVSWLQRSLADVGVCDLTGVDVLVHLASAGVPPQPASAETLLQVNVEAQATLLRMARAAGVRRCVLAGSVAEYGRSAQDWSLIPPDAALLPTQGYAASKAAGFALAHAYAVENALEFAYLRLCPAYGEGQHALNLWPALRLAALRGEDFAMTPGGQLRDYVPVERVAQAFAHAVARTDLRPGQPFVRNVGSGRAVTVLQFAEHWWSHWAATGALRPGALPYRPCEEMHFLARVDADVWPAG